MSHAFLNAARPAAVPLHCSKMAFENRCKARRAMDNMDKDCDGRAFGEGHINVYRCALCGLWHIGHKPMLNTKEKRR